MNKTKQTRSMKRFLSNNWYANAINVWKNIINTYGNLANRWLINSFWSDYQFTKVELTQQKIQS